MSHLKKDTKLAVLLDGSDPLVIPGHPKPYLYLIYSIMSQQLSTKVASVLKSRFHILAGSEEPELQAVRNMRSESLRAIGLSGAKVTYVLAVAEFAVENDLSKKYLDKLENEEVIQWVTQIKGVGRWTAEMLLMFCLGREDVMPLDDLGIQQAMRSVYSIEAEKASALKLEMTAISEKWRPYRTYACMHLWNWKDS